MSGPLTGLLLVALVGVTGALGALARYMVVEATARWWRRSFPLAIFLINISGAFLLGAVTTAFASPAQLPARLALGVGFLGGYTTFSTLSYETLALARRGERLHALANAGGSLLAGALAAFLGLALGLHLA